ncbi:MAG: hypothetical protein ACKOEO_17350, partial [Planctomycetaceae bacterium]
LTGHRLIATNGVQRLSGASQFRVMSRLLIFVSRPAPEHVQSPKTGEPRKSTPRLPQRRKKTETGERGMSIPR